jgi:FkbM family methyltransferase
MKNEISLRFFEEFITSKKKRYIFGINSYSDAISELTEIDGYIDDYTEKTSYRGKPILRLAEVDIHSMVVSTVTNSRPITALKKIKSHGIEHFLDYFSFADASAGAVPQLESVSEMRIDYSTNKNLYEWLRMQLSDTESRLTFDKIMTFRLNADLNVMHEFTFRVEHQYFEPFLNLVEQEIFIDGGGFDGQTTQEFCRRYPLYRSVHFFEPNSANLDQARISLKDTRDIFFYQQGLYESKTSLRFDSKSGSASSINEFGGEQIEVDTLDNLVTEPVTFIKLDLEGAEAAALRGMQNHIIQNHPAIAVAVYHKPNDFVSIPTYILSLREDYRVYLRHYTEGWAETIMFFIPTGKKKM